MTVTREQIDEIRHALYVYERTEGVTETAIVRARDAWDSIYDALKDSDLIIRLMEDDINDSISYDQEPEINPER